jgi:hypothetical protein
MGSRTYVSPAYVSMVYMSLGNMDATYDWLEKAYDDEAEWLLWLPVDPMFDGQRDDPRYKELVRKVGVYKGAGGRAMTSVMRGAKGAWPGSCIWRRIGLCTMRGS